MIEAAKSGRASCRTCREKIDKGELRFGILDFTFTDKGSYKWHHLRCAAEKHRNEVFQYLNQATDLKVARDQIDAVLSGGGAGDGGARPPAPDLTVVDVATLPEWLRKAHGRKGTAPDFVKPMELVVKVPGSPDQRLDDESLQQLLFAMRRDKPGKPDKVMTSFREWLGREAVREIVWTVFSRWSRGEAHMRHKWVVNALVGLGSDDDLAFRLYEPIEGWIKSSKKTQAHDFLELLRAWDTKASLTVVQSLAHRFSYKGWNNPALACLERAAGAKKKPLEDLEDELVPDCGLGADGSRVFDYGPRSFSLVIDDKFDVAFEDAKKNRTRNLPAARASDDPEKVKIAQRDAGAVKKELAEMLKVERTRLDQAMSTGRTWRVDRFRELLVRHPLMQHLTRRVVWEQVDGDGKTVHTFRVDEESETLNVEEEPVELDEALGVRLLHPANAGAELVAKWAELLSDYQIIAPFDQLARPVMAAEHLTRSRDGALTGFPDRAIEQGPLHGVMIRRQWVKGDPDDYVRIHEFQKRFAGFGVDAAIVFDPGMEAWGSDDPQTIREVRFRSSKGRTVSVDRVSPVVVSETLNDVESLLGAEKR